MTSISNFPQSAIALLAASIALFTATPGFTTPVGDAANPSVQNSSTPAPPTPTPLSPSTSSPTPAPSSPQVSKQAEDPMKRDRVSIDEVFPEYCRMYFPSRGTVSLFEYRERMYICLYGVDRWSF